MLFFGQEVRHQKKGVVIPMQGKRRRITFIFQVESEVPLNFIDEVELQEAGWYKQKVGDGSATFDKFVIDAIVAVLTSKAPGIKKAAAEAIANYILNNHLQGSYYTKYLNSQVVDKCTQNYYYSYDWYSDPGRTNYIGTTDTGIQTVNLCRR